MKLISFADLVVGLDWIGWVGVGLGCWSSVLFHELHNCFASLCICVCICCIGVIRATVFVVG